MAERKLSPCNARTIANFYKGLGLDLVRNAMGRFQRKYLLLSPPWSAKQTVLNVKDQTRFRFQVRDAVDISVLKQIYAQEDYSIVRLTRSDELFRHYESIIKSGKQPLIVDCGANIGFSAAYFAEVFPGAKIVAIEPDVENCNLARRNCNAGNVDIFQAAIASEDKVGVVVDQGLGGWGQRVEEREGGGVKMISMNSVLTAKSYADCEPFIVKIDIEGFEKDLFSKNTDWVDRFALLIIELHDWMLPRERSSANFLSTISKLDRDFVHLGENAFSISNRLVRQNSE